MHRFVGLSAYFVVGMGSLSFRGGDDGGSGQDRCGYVGGAVRKVLVWDIHIEGSRRVCGK